MPFLPPNQQRQSTEGMIKYCKGNKANLNTAICNNVITTGWAKKWDHKLMAIILSNLSVFQNFFTTRVLGKFAVKWLIKIPPQLTYVAALACETINVKKQSIHDKLQGNVATYLRCVGAINNQIIKGLLLSLSVRKSFCIWQSCKQALMPLPLTVSCFSKIQIGFYLSGTGSPG